MADRSDDSQSPLDDEPQPRPGRSRRGLTVTLVVFALALAGGVAGVLSRENDPNVLDVVSGALQGSAPLLAGPINPLELQHARCKRASDESDTLFRCTPVMGNAVAGKGVLVEYKDDAISKRLAGPTLTEPLRTGDAVASALAADELETIGRRVNYGCAFSTGINSDGSQAAGSPGGFRCVSKTPPAGSKVVVQRYVEFAADGSLARDFMVTGGE